MTDDRRPDGDGNGNGDDDRPEGVIRALLDLLAEMDEHGERRRRGRWTGDRTSVDYSVSIGGLDEALGTARSGGGRDPALTTRELDDGLLLAADLPGVRADEVSVEVDKGGDERAVSIAVAGDVVGRVPLDDGDWTVVDVSFKNGILEARLTHD